MNRAMTLVVGFLLIGVTLVSGSGIIYLTNSAGSSVVLSVTPAIVNTSIGGSFAVTVNISNVRDLGKWEMTISWNASVMDLDQSSGDAVAEGPFLRSANALTKFQFDPYMSGSGVLSGVSCYILQAKGASGTGGLLQMRFRAIAVGTTSIAISNVKLYDYMGRIMITPPSVDSGKVNVNSASPIHDVAIVAFECPPSAVAGELVLLNATVENLGTFDENWTRLELRVNESLCDSIIASVPACSQTRASFNWTASPVGTHNLTVSVDIISEDANLTNNVAWNKVTVLALPSHDLAISLNPPLPDYAILDENVWVNASIFNSGSFPEEIFIASLYIDKEEVAHKVILELGVGSSYPIDYLWTPPRTGVIEIMALVTSVPSETDTSNNQVFDNITVIRSTGDVGILLVSDDDGSRHEYGTSLQEFENALSSTSQKYELWVESDKGRPTLSELLKYRIVIWTVGDYASRAIDATDGNTLKQYFLAGGNLLIEGQFVAYESNSPSFLEDALHATFGGRGDTLGITMADVSSPLTYGMPSAANWTDSLSHLCDKVALIGGAIKVMGFDLGSHASVSIFDGTRKGAGSVVYCAFALHWLNLNDANTLVTNSVRWLSRITLLTVGSRIINGDENSACFIYPDLTLPDGTLAPCTPSGTMIYALCNNPQNQYFSTATDLWLSANNSIFALFGNPFQNRAVEYYESIKRLSPISFSKDSEFRITDREARVIISMPISNVTSGCNDAFAIYVFKDQDSGNIFLVAYGFGSKGSWAAEVYFDAVIAGLTPTCAGDCYVCTWADQNTNGIPELGEITVEFSTQP